MRLLVLLAIDITRLAGKKNRKIEVSVGWQEEGVRDNHSLTHFSFPFFFFFSKPELTLQINHLV